MPPEQQECGVNPEALLPPDGNGRATYEYGEQRMHGQDMTRTYIETRSDRNQEIDKGRHSEIAQPLPPCEVLGKNRIDGKHQEQHETKRGFDNESGREVVRDTMCMNLSEDIGWERLPGYRLHTDVDHPVQVRLGKDMPSGKETIHLGLGPVQRIHVRAEAGLHASIQVREKAEMVGSPQDGQSDDDGRAKRRRIEAEDLSPFLLRTRAHEFENQPAECDREQQNSQCLSAS